MKPRLLIVGNSADQSARLVGAASDAGWDATLAADPREAIEAVAQDPPRAILVQCGQGDGDGLRLAEDLGRAGPVAPPSLILAVPSEDMDDLRPLAAAMGVFEMIAATGPEVDCQALRCALENLSRAEGSGPAGGVAQGPQVAAAALRLAGRKREASLLKRRVEALRNASEMGSRQVSREEMAPRIVDWAVSLTGSRYGWITLRNPGAPGILYTVARPPSLDQEALNLALSLVQEPLDLDAEELRGEQSLWASLGFGRVLVCPIAGGTSGWIGVADATRAYGGDERSFLESLAAILALQSRNSLALHQAKTATEESKALFKAATLILPYEEPQVVARQVAQTVTSVLGYPHCAVLLPDADGSHLHLAGASGALERVRASLPLEGSGLTVQAFRTGRMVYCPNTAQSASYVPGWELCRAELAIPLIHRNEILGVFDLQSEREQAFQGKDLRVLEAFAQRVAMLLYAARQYQSLLTTKERYEGLCEGAPMGLFTWNMNTGRIEQASAVLKSWAGEEVEGILVESLFTQASRGLWKSWTLKAEREHQPLSAQVQVGGIDEIPPIDCLLTAYPGRGRLQIPGHAVLLARAVEAPPVEPGVDGGPSAPLIPIFLAEPDPVWSSVTRLMLEEWGYPVRVSPDLGELPALLDGPPEERPGLLVVDHTLLDEGGGELIRRWTSPEAPMPLLVLGGTGREGLPTGRVRQLAKPYRMRELREALAKVLG